VCGLRAMCQRQCQQHPSVPDLELTMADFVSSGQISHDRGRLLALPRFRAIGTLVFPPLRGCAAMAQLVASSFVSLFLSEDDRGLQCTYIRIYVPYLRCAHRSVPSVAMNRRLLRHKHEPKSSFLRYATHGLKHTGTTSTRRDGTGLATNMGGESLLI
jgi:hypothetical protein